MDHQTIFDYSSECRKEPSDYWNQNTGDASSSKWLNGDSSPWADLTHHVLLLIMMQLGVADFLAFRRVCKSWRLLAVSNSKKFIASKPPMEMSISDLTHRKGCLCHLEDFEGRKWNTLFHQSPGNHCYGLTCGYVILFSGRTHTRDFWLLNPIKKHQLHFPDFRDLSSLLGHGNSTRIKAILVFSPSLSQWVFVVLASGKLFISIAGKRVWNQISSSHSMLDLQYFKGNIYLLHTLYRLSELRIYPEPKLTLLQFKAIPMYGLYCPELISSGENLYVLDQFKLGPLKGKYTVYEVDIGKMK